jgi:hypothetical protein
MMNPARARRLLEIDAHASWDDIRQSYRDLVRVWHPDRFEGDARLRAKAEHRVAHVTEAYRFLDLHRDVIVSVPPAAAPARAVRVQQVAVAAPVRLSWAGRAAVAAMMLAVLALVMMPRSVQKPVTASALTEMAMPAAAPPQVAAPAPAPKRPAAVFADALPKRSFIARESEALLSHK